MRPQVDVAGRITALRDMGKASFLDLRDGSGRIQCYVKKDIVGDEAYAALADLDLGDFLAVSGPLFRTRTSEITVEARSLHGAREGAAPAAGEVARPRGHRDPLPPALPRPDGERRRARDLPHARRRSSPASAATSTTRGFIEVETPVLQAGGRRRRRDAVRHASPRARPGLLPAHLARAAPQARCSSAASTASTRWAASSATRASSWKYNPEFTMLETYQAYADYNDVARMVEEMVSGIARDVARRRRRCSFGEHTHRPRAAVAARDACATR